MQCKIKSICLILGLILGALIPSGQLFSQNYVTGVSCLQSLNLDPVPDGSFYPYFFQPNSPEAWMVFTANSSSANFEIDLSVQNAPVISESNIFSGNCSALQNIIVNTNQVNNTINIQATGLVAGNTYYFQLKRPVNNNMAFSQRFGMKITRDCLYCVAIQNSGAAAAGLSAQTYYVNEYCGGGALSITDPGDYYLPSITLTMDCPTFCMENCGNILDPIFLTYDGSNAGDSIAVLDGTGTPIYTFDDFDTESNCFTFPSPGTYTISNYVKQFPAPDVLLFSTTVTVLPSGSILPSAADLNGNSYDCYDDLYEDISTILSAYTDYTVSIVFPNGDEVELEWLNNLICEGEYDVVITGHDHCGNEITSSGHITINPLTAVFAANVVNCFVQQFTPSYSGCTDLFTSYTWDFGDGSGMVSSSLPITHTYLGAGEYLVTFSVTSECGNLIDTDTITIKPPTVEFVADNACDLNAGITPSYGCISLITGVSWDFGDGTTSNTFFPGVHTYASSGTYTVTLTYTYNDAFGGIITTSVVHNVTVGASVTPLVITGPNLTCSLTGTFTSSVSVGGSYTWSIPSGNATVTSGNGTNTVIITFDDQSSPVTVLVTSTDTNGCEQTGTYTVNPCCTPAGSLPPSALVTSASSPTNLSAYLGVWPGTFSTTSMLIGKQIYVYEDLTIDRNFTFKSCIIWVAPGKSIHTIPGITVTWNNGQVREMCNEMWQGIFATHPTTTINGDGTIFRSAITAIVSDNGANVDLFNCEFRNDFIGLTVSDYNSGPHPVTVSKCRFLTTTTLITPHAGKQTHKGIDVINVGDLTIGDMAIANTNDFLKMDFGIHSMNSTIKVWNNDFRKIKPTSASVPSYCCGCDLGSGICDVNNDRNNVYSLTAGNNPTIDNNFNDCDYGIFTVGRINEKIQFNEMDKVIGGINIYNNSFTTIDISLDNIIKNYFVGMFIYNIPSAKLTIRDNLLNASGMPAIGQYGIIVTNPIPFYYKADIDANYIDRTNNGIYLQNSVGLSSFSGPVDINVHNNIVHYTQHNVPSGIGTIEQDGIRIENCAALLVQENEVSRTAFGIPVPASAVGYFRGIKVDNSAIVGVIKNNIYGIAEGVRVYGNCNNSLFMCNDFDRNYYAFNFQGPSGTASIGLNQLPGGLAQGNFYTTSHSLSGIDLEGGLSPTVNWWYNSSTSGGYNAISGLSPGSTFGAGSIEDQLTTHSVSETCGSTPTFMPGSNGIGGMIGAVSYDNNHDAFTIYDQMNAFRLLKNNPDWSDDGASGDKLLADFYSKTLLSNIQIFDSVARCIQVDSVLTAQQLNSSMSPSNTFESNMQRVNEIYLSSMNREMSTEEKMELEMIARQNGTLGGPGVYQARAILRLFIDDSDITSEKNEEEIVSEMNHLDVFPNPSTGIFTIEIKLLEAAACYTVDITDINGKVVFTNPSCLGSRLSVDLSEYEAGMYFIRVKSGDSEYFEKLVKQ